jgi:hypothetical protein
MYQVSVGAKRTKSREDLSLSLTRLLFLLAATVRLTAGLLPLLEPRMGIKPTMTKRTSPPREHSFSSSQPQKEKQTERARKEKK